MKPWADARNTFYYFSDSDEDDLDDNPTTSREFQEDIEFESDDNEVTPEADV